MDHHGPREVGADEHGEDPQMLTFPHRPTSDGPWGAGHAAPEDRALGHELELIELQRRRDELAPDHPEVARIDREIAVVVEQLVEASTELVTRDQTGEQVSIVEP